MSIHTFFLIGGVVIFAACILLVIGAVIDFYDEEHF